MEQTIFVGREQEVQNLMAFARKGLAGEASVGFVTGEAGMGKTALVEEVFRRLKADMPDLVMAVGRCNVDSASYLPFRTILEDVLESRTDVQISGELASGRKAKVKDSIVSIIKDVGTDVMSIFLPSTIAGIAGKGSRSLFDKWFGSDCLRVCGLLKPPAPNSDNIRHQFRKSAECYACARPEYGQNSGGYGRLSGRHYLS